MHLSNLQPRPQPTPPDIALTSRKRIIFDDASLAEALWERLKLFFGKHTVTDEDNSTWTASHLNQRFRYCKYEPGGAFEAHFYGRRLAAVNEQSFMTVNIYLNSVPRAHCGATRILKACETCAEPGAKPREHEVLGRIAPTEGLAAVFRDNVFHDGEELRGGVKYLLRTDVMFSRDEPLDLERMCEGMSGEAKGRRALALAVRLEDGNNFQEAIVWYKKAYRLDPKLGTGEG